MNKPELSNAIISLYDLMSRLRGHGGCPWDALQTDSSVMMYLLEEAYEVIDAVERAIADDVCMELGDLLFQIIFLARLAEERGEFDLKDVLQKITEKMIKRHPHVFGSTRVKGPEEVAVNWEKIKKQEKGVYETPTTSLQNVPMKLPALLRAHRLSEKASKVNFDWADAGDVWGKVEEEFEELKEAIRTRDSSRVGEELGDLLFSLVNLARHWDLNAEYLLRCANNKFIKRFGKMEEELNSSGITLEEATSERMNLAWEKVKTKTG